MRSSGESSLRRICGGVFGGGDDDESASRRDDRDRDRPLQVSSSTSSFTTMISSVLSGVNCGVSSADLPFPFARDGLEERRDSEGCISLAMLERLFYWGAVAPYN